MNRDKVFITEKIRKEKRKGRQQGNLILSLKDQNNRMMAILKAKDEEMKKLEIKLLRAQNMTVAGALTRDGESEINGPPEAGDVTLDGVMITQRGTKLANENKDSVYCPFTQNAKFETFLEDIFDMRIAESSMRRQIQDYVKCIETHYTDIISKLRGKMKRLTVEVKIERGK